jgi:hypothetical protein
MLSSAPKNKFRMRSGEGGRKHKEGWFRRKQKEMVG